MLSDSDSESVGDNVLLTINEHYAKAYEYKKEREELAKLKEKYGSDGEGGEEDETDSEEDETEDEDGEELTPAVDAAILRTLARIKRKDPDIYDANKDVFEEEQSKTKEPSITRKSKHENPKPLLMRQHRLQSALEAEASDEESDAPEPLTHTAEQAVLRKETISAFHSAVEPDEDGEGSDDDDLLISREKSKDEIERDQEEYREFLAREVGEDIGGLVTLEEVDSAKEEDADANTEDVKVKAGRKKSKKSKKAQEKKKESDHEFLMNYILNRGWIDKSQRHIPTYSEVTGEEKGRAKAKKTKNQEGREGGAEEEREDENDHEGDDESSPNEFDDEEFDEVAETFEQSYNFRFEEPGAATISAHPRDIASTVRRADTTRKEMRERRKARKEEDLLKKKEEVKRLKALKAKEIRVRLERIKKEGGKSVREDALEQLDLDGDWDPEAHDKQMADIYAGGDEILDFENDDDLEKPTWDDDIDIADIAPPSPTLEPIASSSKQSKKKKKKNKVEDEEEDIGVDISDMDADAPPHKRKRTPTAEERAALAQLDELDFTSLAGGLPTRFKYTPVLPDNFGLTPAEILLADDAELNEYVGLRKMAPYRRDKDGKMRSGWDKGRGERLKELKRKLNERWGEVGADGYGGRGEDGEKPAKKRKGKKERQKEKVSAVVLEDGGEGHVEEGSVIGGEKMEVDEGVQQNGETTGSSKKRRRRHTKAAQTADS